MLRESGRVVAIDDDGVWVETTNKTLCGSCAAEKGCGQSLLARWVNSHGYLKALFNGRDPRTIRINDVVDVGIPEDVVVTSSLIIYLLPLLLLLAGAVVGGEAIGGDAASAVGALLGLLLGAVVVKIYSHAVKHNRRIQPVLLDMVGTSAEIEIT